MSDLILSNSRHLAEVKLIIRRNENNEFFAGLGKTRPQGTAVTSIGKVFNQTKIKYFNFKFCPGDLARPVSATIVNQQNFIINFQLLSNWGDFFDSCLHVFLFVEGRY
jgi:hypothetical protein